MSQLCNLYPYLLHRGPTLQHHSILVEAPVEGGATVVSLTSFVRTECCALSKVQNRYVQSTANMAFALGSHYGQKQCPVIVKFLLWFTVGCSAVRLRICRHLEGQLRSIGCYIYYDLNARYNNVQVI